MKTPKTLIIEVNKCMFPDCEKPSQHRGLCHQHYVAAQRLVKSGTITWETMEKSGKVLPSAQGCRNRKRQSDWFLSGE